MQSLVLTASGFQISDTPIPSLMPGDVRIEVRSVGICGTDLAIWKGEYDAPLPLILGHEIAGVVHESSVPEIRPGTPVTTEIDVSCGRCWYCRTNERHRCPDREILGVTTDGGLTEYLSVPADLIHVLPDNIDMVSATFIEPLSSAIQTQIVTPVQKDEPVVVFGSGKQALLVAQVYDAYGADVHIVGHNRWQLGLARQLGLTNTLDINANDWKKQILSATHGVGPRVVVEATGYTDELSMAIETVRNGGILHINSMHTSELMIDPSTIVRKELTIHGIIRGSFRKAIDLLSTGRIEVKRLVSGQFGLEDGRKAFEHAAQDSVTKVVVNI